MEALKMLQSHSLKVQTTHQVCLSLTHGNLNFRMNDWSLFCDSFSELEIPLYESKEQFHEKLLLAISEGKEGFYIA